MKEITRIHIAKVAYDIELTAKKQLEKYIKSLEVYTQDKEVLEDIEIRMTEILRERGVKEGGVVSSEDVAALRAQLGEPYEFADGESDIALGPEPTETGRRLFRSTDNAVLGGVLSGMAAYFNVNPLWTRLVFILLVFISFGTAAVVYVLFWILTPAARTATEKLQMAGKTVTVESIRELNSEEEKTQPNRLAPALRRFFAFTFGTLSALAALGVLAGIIALITASFTAQAGFVDVTNGFSGLGEDRVWLVQILFWVTVFGLVLLMALFSLVSYAFFARKVTKATVISGVVIIVLGVASAATVVTVGLTQSVRVASESRAMVRETKAPLAREFANVKKVVIENKTASPRDTPASYISNNATIRYVVDGGPARYELSGLPTTKMNVVIDGETAVVSLTVPESFRNAFVQPLVTIYGPALTTVTAGEWTSASYQNERQATVDIVSGKHSSFVLNGTYGKVQVEGSGSVDVASSSVETLSINAQMGMDVAAGVVRELTVTQPDVCPSGFMRDATAVRISGVTSGSMTYNGKVIPVSSQSGACGDIELEDLKELTETEIYQ